MKSIPKLNYWERKAFFEGVDVAIIGSGIVGLSAALYLKETDPHLKVIVIERGSLPMGASTRNAGFACFGSMTELLDDLKTHDESTVLDLVEKRWSGLQRLRERIGDRHLRYKEWGGFEIFKPSEKAIFKTCEAQIDYLNKAIASITKEPFTYQIQDDTIAKFGMEGIEHMVCNQSEGQIDTGQMMLALLHQAREKDIQILNGCTIDQIEDSTTGVHLMAMNGWELKAGKVIVATNGFAKNIISTLSVEPARNQVLITKPIPNLKIKGCFHYDKGYYYFRNIDQRILLGGGRNLNPKEEQTTNFGTTDLIKTSLVDLLKKVILPQQKVEIDLWWSGILGIGTQKKPIIRMHSPNVAVAVRMGGMGIAIGSLVGEEGAKLVLSGRS